MILSCSPTFTVFRGRPIPSLLALLFFFLIILNHCFSFRSTRSYVQHVVPCLTATVLLGDSLSLSGVCPYVIIVFLSSSSVSTIPDRLHVISTAAFCLRLRRHAYLRHNQVLQQPVF